MRIRETRDSIRNSEFFETIRSLIVLMFSMPRIARVVAEGVPHHVTQRGNARQQVFHCAEDYALYKDLLSRYAARSGLALWADCLRSEERRVGKRGEKG